VAVLGIMDNGNDPPPALSIWNFLMKNMLSTNSGLTQQYKTTTVYAKKAPQTAKKKTNPVA